MNTLNIIEKIKSNISQVIVGQENLVDRLILALLVNGHVLLEGVPGLAKTRTVNALARSLNLAAKRVQFTPDLLPSDLIGTEVYRPQTTDFVIRKGVLFSNIIIADEINRAPAKVQSALLQAMQERTIAIADQLFKLEQPFLVLATQNPIEQEGTYPLPEAQLDRFLFKIKVDYPSYEEEIKIAQNALNENDHSQTSSISPVVEKSDIFQLREKLKDIHLPEAIVKYCVSLVHATRNSDAFNLRGMVEWGASPRASISLVEAGRGLALIRGKEIVTPELIKELAHDIMRHRIIPSFEAQARNINTDEIIRVLLKSVAIP
jgi:MoxR-like ATPase